MRAKMWPVVAAVLLAAGCADPGGEEGPGAPPASSQAPTGSPAPDETVLRGTVIDGVEPNCLVLSTEQGQYLLLGGDQDVLREGEDVVVEGIPQPGRPTVCQQGIPFTVTEARVEPAQP